MERSSGIDRGNANTYLLPKPKPPSLNKEDRSYVLKQARIFDSMGSIQIKERDSKGRDSTVQVLKLDTLFDKEEEITVEPSVEIADKEVSINDDQEEESTTYLFGDRPETPKVRSKIKKRRTVRKKGVSLLHSPKGKSPRGKPSNEEKKLESPEEQPVDLGNTQRRKSSTTMGFAFSLSRRGRRTSSDSPRSDGSDNSPIVAPLNLKNIRRRRSSGSLKSSLSPTQRVLSSRRLSTPKSPTDPEVTKYAQNCLTCIDNRLKENQDTDILSSVGIYRWLTRVTIDHLKQLEPKEPNGKEQCNLAKRLQRVGLPEEATEKLLNKVYVQLRYRINLLHDQWDNIVVPKCTHNPPALDQQKEVAAYLHLFIQELYECDALHSCLKVLNIFHSSSASYLRDTSQLLAGGAPVLHLLNQLIERKKRAQLYKEELDSLRYHVLADLNAHEIPWPNASESKVASKFASFAHYDGNSFYQDLRGWALDLSPFFEDLTFQKKGGDIYEFNTSPFSSQAASFPDRSAFLLALVHQAQAMGYAQLADQNVETIVSNLEAKKYVPYFSRLFRAGANGIFAPASTVLYECFQATKGEFAIDHRFPVGDGTTEGGEIQLHVEFLSDTDFVTTYKRQMRLVRANGSLKSSDSELAHLQCVWKLNWRGKEQPPEGTLRIELTPSKSIAVNELWRVLQIWAQSLPS